MTTRQYIPLVPDPILSQFMPDLHFSCGLFNDAVSSSENTYPNDSYWIVKDAEECDCEQS
jgi:hypothetical protein